MTKLTRFFFALAIASLFVPSVFANGNKEDSKSMDQGKVLNIYAWNDEFQTRFNDYYAAKLPADVTVNWIITPNADNAYQNKLDEALLAQDSVSNDEKIDIFLVEADYALKYVDTPYTLDVNKTIGLTDSDLANQYQYTKDIMTDSKGVLKGVSWQACPGGFIYRRSIAEDVIGSSDPKDVQAALDSWDKFDSVAAEAKAKDYFMLSGYDDAFRVFSDNMSSKWVKGNKINIDPSIERWIDMTKEYTDLGYNNKANLWSAESWGGAAVDGRVFGYFGPGWFVDFCLGPATLDDPDAEKTIGNGSYGDWGLVKGPQGFSWGGTWICGAAGSDNLDLIKDIMYTLTVDEDVLVAIAQDKGDFTNNEASMARLAASDYQNSFLGGQNHMAEFLESAKSIDRSSMSAYDQGMTEKLMNSFSDYFNGTVTKEQAWDNFYTAVLELYPNLSK
ncbi:carbohydrate ABC transporter substrate-binding protein [Thiospirochaeta perfilievii]|uniref:Carbohydrate ABC transporter substrate-binding protein n=1 Tax=Thiospirochaeta perfilievii TaxID=252967 RepID=A0A5C1QCJ2_9SPIO|nr:ABC transporter substrate-binding protein [Thiospirochaeta perfilievii]QEN04394.1 carbohydrate ABC transporter substrate-binding protein [Thiospirochaeta perfilievii]